MVIRGTWPKTGSGWWRQLREAPVPCAEELSNVAWLVLLLSLWVNCPESLSSDEDLVSASPFHGTHPMTSREFNLILHPSY